jgi:hypothetical protein
MEHRFIFFDTRSDLSSWFSSYVWNKDFTLDTHACCEEKPMERDEKGGIKKSISISAGPRLPIPHSIAKLERFRETCFSE